MNLSRRSNASRQPLKGDPSSIGLGGFNFSKRIVKKYSFSERFSRLPVLVFLRLFGLRDTDSRNSLEKSASPEWRINNYFEHHFYAGVIRESINAPGNQPQKQYNVSHYRNILPPGMIGGPVDQRSSQPQKFFWFSGGSDLSYPSVVKLTVHPAKHVTGSYLQKIFNMVNTGSGSPATATKELLINKRKNAEEADIPVLKQNVRNYGGNPERHEKDGENVLFSALVPITIPAKKVLDSMNLASNGHLQKISAKDGGLKQNKTTPPSEIQSSNKESLFSDIILTKMKIPTYRHVLSEGAAIELKRITRENRFVKTIPKRNVLAGLVLKVQKMNEQKNERLSGRKQGTFPDNFIPAAKPVRIEDTIDNIVRKHTDLILRKPSVDNIANNIKKQDVMKTTNEEVQERNINKIIAQERKPADINTIADTVYKLIERRLLIEKEKRGLV